MSYKITNLKNKLLFKLYTKLLTPSNLKLNLYLNDSTTHETPLTPTVSSTEDESIKLLTYDIPLSQFSLNDTITFELEYDGNRHLWQTNEGITWVIDGKEVATTMANINPNVAEQGVHADTFTYNFTEAGVHSIQAVYSGNDSYAMAMTPKQLFQVSQPDIQESGSLDNNGAYRIQFVNKGLKSMDYDDGTVVRFRLTKGGVPVPNKTIEMYRPTGEPDSGLTDNKGYASWTNGSSGNHYDAGTYTLGAFYQADGTHTTCRCSKKVTINKGTPVITHNNTGAGFIKGGQFIATLKYNGNAMTNTKLTVYTNGKAHTYTTNDSGKIYIKLSSKGTFKTKIVYKGDKNHKQVEESTTIIVVENT